MKPKTLLLALFAFVMLTASECEKKDLTTLPPETQEGKNTFGCLINGEVFVKSQKVPIFTSAISASYSLGAQILGIRVYTHPYGYVHLDVEPLYNVQPMTFFRCYFSPLQSESGECYSFGGKNIGIIELTCFDVANRIVSGRFSFDGQCLDIYENPIGNSIVHITEGRFDIKLEIYE